MQATISAMSSLSSQVLQSSYGASITDFSKVPYTTLLAIKHCNGCCVVLSGSQLVIFDPHCTYLPNITPQNPGKRIDFVASSAADTHPDQFAPYQAFSCNARSYFDGTLFRFPLRTAEQAAKSRISKQVPHFFWLHIYLLSVANFIDLDVRAPHLQTSLQHVVTDLALCHGAGVQR